MTFPRYDLSAKWCQFFPYTYPGIQYGVRNPDTRPENVSILQHALTRVRSDRSPQFQRLYPCFRGRSVQWYVCRHRIMLLSTGN